MRQGCEVKPEGAAIGGIAGADEQPGLFHTPDHGRESGGGNTCPARDIAHRETVFFEEDKQDAAHAGRQMSIEPLFGKMGTEERDVVVVETAYEKAEALLGGRSGQGHNSFGTEVIMRKNSSGVNGGAEGAEPVFEFGCEFGFEGNGLAGGGLGEADAPVMKEEVARVVSKGAIESVALVALENAEVGDGVASGFGAGQAGGGHADGLPGVAADGAVDSALGSSDDTRNQREIGFLDFAIGELLLEVAVGEAVPGYEDEAGGELVETVDDARAA